MTDLTTAIDLCICTFRRAHIARTLQSIALMEIPKGYTLHLIVADNDDTPSARELVEQTAQNCGLECTYIHAPARNISIARNACLDAATAKFVAFIDDDELVLPQWLAEMTATLNNTRADAVMGPVNAVYGPDTPRWMKDGNFHSTIPVMTNGRIITGGSGNVLMRMDSPAIIGRRFRPDLGKSGGEDSEFFASIHRVGGHIAFAERAIVTEEVPASRATMGWLMLRRLRYGQTHGLLLLASGARGLLPRLQAVAVATCKGLFSFGMALLLIVRPDRMRFWLLRGALHWGVVTHLLGGRTVETYGSEKPS